MQIKSTTIISDDSSLGLLLKIMVVFLKICKSTTMFYDDNSLGPFTMQGDIF